MAAAGPRRHDGTSPLPLGMDASAPPKTWRGRFSVWPNERSNGWSFCAMIPSWTTVPPKGGPASGPVVYFRVLVGLQSPEGFSTSRATLRRYSDFVRLHDILKRLFPNKKIPLTPPKHSFQRVNKNVQLLQQRRSSLEEWVQTLLEDIELSRSVAIASFLELEPLARKAVAECEAEKSSKDNSSANLDPNIQSVPEVNSDSNSISDLNFESSSHFQTISSQSEKISGPFSPSSQDILLDDESKFENISELESDDGGRLPNLDENEMEGHSLRNGKRNDQRKDGSEKGAEEYSEDAEKEPRATDENEKEKGVGTSVSDTSVDEFINSVSRSFTHDPVTTGDENVDSFINSVLQSAENDEIQSQEKNEQLENQINQVIQEATTDFYENGPSNSVENSNFELKSQKSFLSDLDSNLSSEDNLSIKSAGENMNKLSQLFSSKSSNKIKNMFFSDLVVKKEEGKEGMRRSRLSSSGAGMYGEDDEIAGELKGTENADMGDYDKDMHEKVVDELSLIFPKSKQMIVAKTLLSLKRRLEMAASDMEDLISRLNQEVAMKNFFARKVKELEEEHELALTRNQESLRYALSEEKEMSIALQWEAEELRNNVINMEERLKAEQMAKNKVEEELMACRSSMEELKQSIQSFKAKEEAFVSEKQQILSQWTEEKQNLDSELQTLKSENSDLKSAVESAKKMQHDLEKEMSERFEQSEKRKKEQDRFLQEIKTLWQRLRECSLENLILDEKRSRKIQSTNADGNSNSNSNSISLPEVNHDKDEAVKVDFSSSDIFPLLETSENRLAVLVAEAELLAREGKEDKQREEPPNPPASTGGLVWGNDANSHDHSGKENGILMTPTMHTCCEKGNSSVKVFRNLLLQILLENAQLRKSMNSLSLNALLVAQQSDKKLLPKKSFFSGKFM